MKTNKTVSWFISMVATIAITVACAGPMSGQTAASKSSGASMDGAAQWSVQVQSVNPGDLNVAGSFQIAIYENLLAELKKSQQFNQVFREGDRKAQEVPNLLILKTTVEKYSEGSETKRAVTTVSGATKLTVRSQLVTTNGKVVLDRTVSGDVRFFGGNLKATHTLASNIAKTIKQAQLSTSDQPATVSGEL